MYYDKGLNSINLIEGIETSASVEEGMGFTLLKLSGTDRSYFCCVIDPLNVLYRHAVTYVHGYRAL